MAMLKMKLTKWDSLPIIKSLPKQKDRVTWAFATQKGGVGKTTLAWTFSEAIRAASSTNTLLINFDGQTNIIDTALKNEGEGEIIDTGRYITTMDLFDLNIDSEGNLAASPLMDKEIYVNSRGIHLIPSNRAFDKVNRLEDDATHLAAPFVNLAYLTDKHDIGNTILDCQPHLGFGTKSALFISDFVIPPAVPHEFSVSGFAAMCYELRSANLVRRDLELPDIKLVGFLINQFNKSSAIASKDLKELRLQLGDAVLEKVITFRNPIADSTSIGTPIWENRRGGSPEAATEMLEVIQEVLDRASSMYLDKSDPHNEVVLMLADFHDSNNT